MAKGPSGPSSGKRKSRSKPSVSDPAAQAQPPTSSQPETINGLKRYQVPAHFQENSAPLSMDTELLDLDSELWLFQLPHELDPVASLSWQLSTTAEGGVTGTCQDAEGVSYTLAEEPSEVAIQLYTTPAAGSSIPSRFKRRVTVVRANQMPDAIAQAEAVEAVMPSADMPGIPSASLTTLIHQVPNTVVQKQQQQQDHQAGQDLLATPQEPRSKQKKAKSEVIRLKERAQEATAVNEKQSKLQRQSDAPVLAPEALHVSVGPEVKSQAAALQEEAAAPSSDKKHKKDKKRKKDKKDKKMSAAKNHKQRDASNV